MLVKRPGSRSASRRVFFHIRGVETDGDLPLLLLFLQVRVRCRRSATLVVGPEVAEFDVKTIEAAAVEP